jgi:hypothetical protein
MKRNDKAAPWPEHKIYPKCAYCYSGAKHRFVCPSTKHFNRHAVCGKCVGARHATSPIEGINAETKTLTDMCIRCKLAVRCKPPHWFSNLSNAFRFAV